MLGDQAAVGINGGSSSDGSPLSRGVDKGDVDVRVGGEVVSLARLGVGVEEQVNASSLLKGVSVDMGRYRKIDER